MLLDLIRGGNALSVFMGVCVSAFVVFCLMPIHEYAHALVATKLGFEADLTRDGMIDAFDMAAMRKNLTA